MKTGQNVVLTRQISYPARDEHDNPITGILDKGTKGTVSGIIEAGEDVMVLFQPDGVEQVFAVSNVSVQKYSAVK